MLRFQDIVFGPIHSRRLGSSLGINLLPADGKLCNFDCIYCECGWNKDGRCAGVLPKAEDLRQALTAKLQECHSQGIHIDSITFSGNGEPTLNPDFPQIIDITLSLRDKFYPESKVSVLSNATMTGRPAVLAALKKVDNPILKIDASSNSAAAIINRPSGQYDVSQIVQNLKQFNGNFVLQTMFLKSPEFDTAAPQNLLLWYDLVRTLRPREIMVYTLDRETPQKELEKYTLEEMTSHVRPLIDEGFNIQIRG